MILAKTQNNATWLKHAGTKAKKRSQIVLSGLASGIKFALALIPPHENLRIGRHEARIGWIIAGLASVGAFALAGAHPA